MYVQGLVKIRKENCIFQHPNYDNVSIIPVAVEVHLEVMLTEVQSQNLEIVSSSPPFPAVLLPADSVNRSQLRSKQFQWKIPERNKS